MPMTPYPILEPLTTETSTRSANMPNKSLVSDNSYTNLAYSSDMSSIHMPERSPSPTRKCGNISNVFQNQTGGHDAPSRSHQYRVQRALSLAGSTSSLSGSSLSLSENATNQSSINSSISESPCQILYNDIPQTKAGAGHDNHKKLAKDLDDDLDKPEDTKQAAVPDGGCLAWAIVVASFMVSFLQDGFRDSFGLLLPTVSEKFQTGRTEAAMTNSIMTFLTLGSGPLVALLVNKLGHRVVTIIGVSLATAGLLAAGFSIEYLHPPSLLILYITVGCMTGLGFGLMYLPAMDIIEVYFDKNLGLATGIAAAGSGVGQLVMAPVIQLVSEKLGLAFTMIALAASVACAIIFAFMYRMPKQKRSSLAIYEGMSDLTFFHEDVKVLKVTRKKSEFEDISEDRNETTKDSQEEEIGCFAMLLKSYWSIFKSTEMVILLISHFLMHISIFAAFAFTADRAIKLGIPKDHISHLLSIMGICNCAGRIAFGKALDTFRSKAFFLTTIILLINAGIVTFSDFMQTFRGQCFYSGIFGSTFGAYISSVVVILKEINKSKITESLGVCLFVFALASLVGPAIVGQVFDTQQDYRLGFIAAGSLGLVGAILLPLVHVVIEKKKKVSHL